MKTSLKTLLILSSLAIHSLAFSQSENRETSVKPAAETWKVKFGTQFGMNISNIKSSSGAYEGADISPRIGFNIGMLLDINLKKSFAIQTGLLFSTRGTNYTFTYEYGYYDGYGSFVTEEQLYRTKLTYLELPVNLLYNLQVGKGNFFFGAGPYFSTGIYGKDKLSITYSGMGMLEDYEDEIKVFEGDYKMYSRFDMGLSLLGGYEFYSGLYLKTGYAIGLKNISDPAYSEDKINEKNRCFDISIGCKIR